MVNTDNKRIVIETEAGEHLYEIIVSHQESLEVKRLLQNIFRRKG